MYFKFDITYSYTSYKKSKTLESKFISPKIHIANYLLLAKNRLVENKQLILV